MKLYFLRHGDAEDRRAGGSDAERRLTPEGIEEMERAAKGMRALDLQLDALFTSPYLRARETAEIVAAALGRKEQLRENPLLACGCTLGGLLKVIEDEPERSRVLLVGHEPDFSTLVSRLIGGGAVRMKKGSLACVDWTPPAPGTGELRWLMEPEQLGALK